jgi:hypothetical protein
VSCLADVAVRPQGFCVAHFLDVVATFHDV